MNIFYVIMFCFHIFIILFIFAFGAQQMLLHHYNFCIVKIQILCKLCSILLFLVLWLSFNIVMMVVEENAIIGGFFVFLIFLMQTLFF
jgi:hypothetical protein